MCLRGGKSLLGICLIVTLLGCTGVASRSNLSQTSQTSTTSTTSAPTPLNVNVPVDRYGGRLDISCTTSAGKWHTEKINSRWWVCTPAGHAFFRQSLYVTGPAANFNIAAKYGSEANYVTAELGRITSWKFNALDLVADEHLWATASPAPSILVPFIDKELPSIKAGVKNIWAAMPGPFYTFFPWLPTQPDPSDPRIDTEAAYLLAHGDVKPSNSNIGYLMQVSLDDADNMWAFHNDGCSGNPVFHLGWVSLATSPVQNAGTNQPYATTNFQALYYNNQHISKAGLEIFLQHRYNNSISALNTAWGSSYTQFDSTGTTVTGETVATGDGRITAYTHTLANSKPSRYSIGITIGGTLVAGDLAHDSGGGNADPTNTTDGRIWGPYVTGKITFGTGALSVTFSTTRNSLGANTISSISMASNVVTVVTQFQHGLWTGAKVNISSTTNYNGTALGPITVVDETHFTYALTGTFGTETTGTYALNAVPGASDTISVTYIFNGWEIGSGLMDEANNYSWSNGDKYACNLSVLSSAMQADLNDYLYQIAYTYYSGLAAQVHMYFPNAMYGGIDGMDGVAKAPILKAAGQVLDVMILNYGNQLTQSQLDTLWAGYGDRPIYDSFYVTANLDSANATVPDVSPHYLTQEAKGRAYYSRMQSALDKTYAATGSHPYVGMGVWSYVDMNDGNGYRFGLVTSNDNAYDGYEDTPLSKNCSTPLQTYTCVAESTFTIPIWHASSSVPGNAYIHVVSNIGGTYYIFENTNGGTTGGSQPNWASNCPAPGDTCSDNGVIWNNMGVWTKSANPSDYGNAITGISQGNTLWLSVSP